MGSIRLESHIDQWCWNHITKLPLIFISCQISFQFCGLWEGSVAKSLEFQFKDYRAQLMLQ